MIPGDGEAGFSDFLHFSMASPVNPSPEMTQWEWLPAQEQARERYAREELGSWSQFR